MLIDFTQVSDEPTEFELLPKGNYTVTVTDVQEKISNNTKNEYWAITFYTEDGNKIFENLVFTEKTFNRVKKMFSCLGLNVNGKYDYAATDLYGLKMNAYILIEEYIDKRGNTKQKNVIDLWACSAIETPNNTEILIKEEEISF